jgi:hypothetical protein
MTLIIFRSPDGSPRVGVLRPMRFRVRGDGRPGDVPSAAVFVGRGSKWEKPHRMSVARYREYLFDRPDLGELRGKHLACTCSLGSRKCHADILLELANW